MKSIISWMYLLIFFSFSNSLFGNTKGHKIDIEITNFNQSELYLCYYLCNKTYIKDTAYRKSEGKFVFSGSQPLESGVYMIVLPPENTPIEILIDEKDQHFSIQLNADNLDGSIKFLNSASNSSFRNYLIYLNEKSELQKELKEMLEIFKDNPSKKQIIENQIISLENDVKSYQNQIIQENPRSLLSLLIKINLSIEIPEFSGSEDEIYKLKVQYYIDHYFDNIDLGDDRLLRTQFLYEKIMFFLYNLTIQEPHHVILSLDRILNLMPPSNETFKTYLIEFLNEFATSKKMGMDAVYVHLAMNYYAKGYAPWVDSEQLEKIVQNARELEPILIGKIAPHLKLENRMMNSVSLHEMKSDYIVLMFWNPSSSQCKKDFIELVEIHKKLEKRGVQLVFVCTLFQKDTLEKFWSFLDENRIQFGTHLYNPSNSSQFQTIYNVKLTPTYFLLDNNKKIIAKNFALTQIFEILDHNQDANINK